MYIEIVTNTHIYGAYYKSSVIPVNSHIKMLRKHFLTILITIFFIIIL